MLISNLLFLFRKTLKKGSFLVFGSHLGIMSIAGGMPNGQQSIFFENNVTIINQFSSVFKNKLGVSSFMCLRYWVLKKVISLFILVLYSINFGWFFRYSMIGYNFTFRNSFKRRLIRLNLGYSRHKFVINIPKSILICVKNRRKLIIFGNIFASLFTIVYYIHNLRNILPYKIRGLVLEEAQFAVLKVGKKTKFK